MAEAPSLPRQGKRKEAVDLHPIIDAIQYSLDRFQVIYEEHGDVTSALLDLQANMGDLDDAVDRNEGGRDA